MDIKDIKKGSILIRNCGCHDLVIYITEDFIHVNRVKNGESEACSDDSFFEYDIEIEDFTAYDYIEVLNGRFGKVLYG